MLPSICIRDSKITTQLYEYQRVDENTFAIQTSRERLMVVFEPVEADTDIRERTIKEFYYSKLIIDGQRTTFKPYEPLPETYSSTNIVATENIRKNEYMKKYPQINEYGDLMTATVKMTACSFIPPRILAETGYSRMSLQHRGPQGYPDSNDIQQAVPAIRALFCKTGSNQQIPELVFIVVING